MSTSIESLDNVKDSIIIVWFRQDLRLEDNPALIAANQSGSPILPIYILDDVNSDNWQMGGASRWWLHQSLESLSQSLEGHLCLQKGNPLDIFEQLITTQTVKAIYWNRCYEPWRVQRDNHLKEHFKQRKIETKSFNGSLLFEPHNTLKADGTPYKVFTPFFKKGCLTNSPTPPHPETAPARLSLINSHSLNLNELDLMPDINWYQTMQKHWQPGEQGAHQALTTFLDNGLKGYKDGRNFPNKPNTSRLSPYLHFGEISPRRVWHEAQAAMAIQQCEKDGEHFLSELGWREFSNNLLYYFPNLPKENLQPKFDRFPWNHDPEALVRWQTGQTGYPIVDAGMRELWQTGYMHNRVRMIVGSFLVKNLLLHWHHGEDWFWDTLLDADLANNSASWQWIAGCGADAAPYFRVFNPVTQGQKFDAEGDYVRQYVPEIAKLPNKYLHAPWQAPKALLQNAGITLGCNYPEPIVDLKASRERALAAFKSL
jgi:deoxyribodipyrimidine photo-lyase